MKSFVLCLLITVSYQDLPIHCLQSQISGEWTVKFSDLTEQKNFDKNQCGHTIPDDEKTSFYSINSKNLDQSTFTHSLIAKLENNNSLTFDKIQSTQPIDTSIEDSKVWTMIYDEGFELLYGTIRFFFFNAYMQEKNQYISDCASTLQGWVYDTKSQKRGCAIAFKNTSQKIINKSQDKLIVTQNRVEKVPNQQFLQLNLYMQSSFQHQMRLVQHINEQNLSYSTKVYDRYMHKTFFEINSMAGRMKVQFTGKSIEKTSQILSAEHQKDYERLDAIQNFDVYDKFVQLTQEQGDCGSCYAVAALAMLESRFWKKYPKDRIKLSVQQAIDCSVQNQGCDGGYPYLVEKFGEEYHLVEEKHRPYKEKTKDNQCFEPLKGELKRIFKVKNRQYVGGAYGKSSEYHIMKEVEKNGPITVSFEPDMAFNVYSKGIYEQANFTNWYTNNLKKPEWLKVDHSVLLYGWGKQKECFCKEHPNVKEEAHCQGTFVCDMKKYWKLVNSWGSDWGEDGHFRMIRGVDFLGIESIGEAAELEEVDLTNDTAQLEEIKKFYNHKKF